MHTRSHVRRPVLLVFPRTTRLLPIAQSPRTPRFSLQWHQWGLCLLLIAGIALLITVAATALLLLHTDSLHNAYIMAEYRHPQFLTA